jgi:hypothetical protein
MILAMRVRVTYKRFSPDIQQINPQKPTVCQVHFFYSKLGRNGRLNRLT